jgi:hypothetical protein
MLTGSAYEEEVFSGEVVRTLGVSARYLDIRTGAGHISCS